MYIYIIVSTIVVYFILTYLDEQRNLQLHKPPTSFNTKAALGFFAFIISVIGIYLLYGGLFNGETSGGDIMNNIIENTHLKNINQEVEFGLPSF